MSTDTERPGRPPVADAFPPGPPAEPGPAEPSAAPPAGDVPGMVAQRRRLDPPRQDSGAVEPAPRTDQLHAVCSGCGAVVGNAELHGLFHDQLAVLRADVDELLRWADPTTEL